MDTGVFNLIIRILHQTSSALLGGTIIFNYLFNTEELLVEDTKYETFLTSSGVIAIVSGLGLRLYTASGKEIESGSTASLWKHMHELLFFLSLFLTPAVKPLIYQLNAMELIGSSQKEQDDFKKVFQFYIVVFLIILREVARTFREYVCNNFDKDPVAQKVEAFQKKYMGIEKDIKSGKRKEPIKIRAVNLGGNDGDSDSEKEEE